MLGIGMHIICITMCNCNSEIIIILYISRIRAQQLCSHYKLNEGSSKVFEVDILVAHKDRLPALQ